MISIIVAIAQNNAIGCHNKLLWHIGEDLRRFKALTTSHTIVMGRKTYESIGRPLPNRHNIVVSRDKTLQIDGATVVNSLDDALNVVSPDEELFVIGGGDIYRQALPLAQKLYVTHVNESPQADAFFPLIDPQQWQQVSCEQREGYSFVNYNRK